ncbi:hypothetical protein LAZ67_12000136 [Cordylochernes scorpioides]|uniref:Helix-turn-helix domain-containing protein n=1 Tax=Cordylochernes scorpioides TaxID=51811 RepID=A0ABY6L459_9ARAC|nr:hypothetical protein LAZ67_12000136 [Cordylochernes scorpioides]
MRKEDLRLLEMIEELALTFDEERDQKRKAAKQEILKIQEENRNTFKKKRKKEFVYKEGDLVVIQKTQFATKSKLYPNHIHVKCNSTCVRSVVMKSNREFENRAAIIVALRAGRSLKEIVDFLKLPKTTIYRVKKQFD